MIERTSAEKIARNIAKIPGYERDPDGRGFKSDTPEGKAWLRNVMFGDEIFESEFFGTLNISEMYRRIGSNSERFFKFPLEPFVGNVALREINVRHAKGLSRERLRMPIIVAFASDGIQVLDGAHRIFRLNKLRKSTVSAVVAQPNLLRVSRIRRKLLDRTGSWYSADSISEEQFEKEVLAGERFVAKMSQ